MWAHADRLPGAGLDLEAEAGGQTHRPQGAQPVLGEALGGIADGADDAGLQVLHPPDEIDHPLAAGIVEQAVDGEVAAAGVLLGAGELDPLRVPAVGVRPLAPEAGHVVLALLQAHEDDAELRPHGDGVLEELHHPSGVGVGGHVPVLRPAAQQQVADAAAGEVGPVAGAAETLDHRRRAGIDLPGIDGTYLPHSGTPARL